MKTLLLIPVFFFISLLPAQSQDEVDVNLFDFLQFYSDAENCLYKTSCNLAFEQLEQRKSEISRLSTKDDFLNRQSLVREKLNKIIGPLPKKTPLNARVTGVIKKKDYRVEKVVYESIPGYYVTAALFLPTRRKGKLPAVIYASGHTVEGFRSPTYQHIIINLVKKGFAVLAFDPVGQGERWFYFDETTGERRFNSPTIEHSYPGAQCYISGYSPINYFVWDGIRSVDYLLSRKEIDPDRIGMTGRSGGGTQTIYTAAFDDRILAAAPECFITSMEYILKSIGPQDAEQNLFHQISEGLDHADFLEVRAPKPALVITTTRDFFSIQGARETYKEAKQFYQGLGSDGYIGMVEDDDVHTSTRKNREAMYAFFQEYLDNPGSPEDLEVEIFEEQELWVTETGQLATSLKGESLFSLNKKVVQEQMKELETSRNQEPEHLTNVVNAARELSGFEYPKHFETAIFSGRYVQDAYLLEKYLIPGGGDYMLPAALFKPIANPKNELVLILDEQGMEHAANHGQLIHPLVQQGYTVLIADLPGIGSLGPGYLKGDAYVAHTSFNQWFAGILTGKSIVAIRAEDIARLVNFIKTIDGIEAISALSVGTLGSELLHFAAFDKDVEKIAVIAPFLSFVDVAQEPEYKPSFMFSSVSGAIDKYYLPDLIASSSRKKVLIVNPLSPTGDKISEQGQIDKLLEYPQEVYTNEGASMNLQSVTAVADHKVLDQVLSWLK